MIFHTVHNVEIARFHAQFPAVVAAAASVLLLHDKMLIHEKIYNGASFKEMAEKYNINYNSLSQGLKVTLNEIKKTCQHLR